MPEELKDQYIKCCDCGKDFTFPVRDQEFFKQKGFTPPKRCKPCRQINKAKKDGRPQGA